MPGKCRFNNAWLHSEKYSIWLESDHDPGRAKCRLCKKSFDISNMGEAALSSHAKGAKHLCAVAHEETLNPITGFFTPTNAVTSTASCSALLQSSVKQGTMSSAVSRNEALSAEVLWALKMTNSHYSYKSCEDISQVFQAMFPDSKIAVRFACGERKCAYICTFGLALYFKKLTLSNIMKQRAYVMLFDESLNHYLQTKQLDMHVRLWDGSEVKTKYIGSEFLGHSTAQDITEKMKDLLFEIGIKNLIQISMDGPNVNWKVFEILQRQVQNDVGKSLINIGSCGLHILHNALRDGCKITRWEIEHGLSSLYWLFHDCPARHEDFMTATGWNTPMLKFCKHRWVENVNVSERALLLWPHVKHYVEIVERGELPNPKVKSFEEVKTRVADPLFTVKVGIFNSIAREINPFLTMYQSDQPMLPFLSDDMYKLIKGLMGRFLKEKHLREATSTLKLLQVPFEDSSLHKDGLQIDIGFAAEATLKTLKNISERQRLEIKIDCKKLLITLLQKLLKKAPVHHTFVRSMQCLDPRRMAECKELCACQMKRILHILVEAKHIEEAVCDDILREFREFCDMAALQAKFRDFDPKTDRVDTLLYETMGTKPSFLRVWDLVKILLVLSHGQASVERGFSINKELIVENQKETSLVARRLIVDHVRSVGGITKVEITKDLLLSAAGARQKYYCYLDEQKRKKEQQAVDLKRKALTDELDDLKKKRARLEADICALEKSVDEYAEKAEASSNLTFIAKSNSFRRTAKDKKASLLKLEKQIDEKLAQMKK